MFGHVLLDLICGMKLLYLLGGHGVQVEQCPLDLITCEPQLHVGEVTLGCGVVAGVTASVAMSSLVVVVVAGMGTVHHGQGVAGSRCGSAHGRVWRAQGGETPENGWG